VDDDEKELVRHDIQIANLTERVEKLEKLREKVEVIQRNSDRWKWGAGILIGLGAFITWILSVLAGIKGMFK
jgi:hypothetical protein